MENTGEEKPLKGISCSKIPKALKRERQVLEEDTPSVLHPNVSSVLTGRFHGEPNLDSSPPLLFKKLLP